MRRLSALLACVVVFIAPANAQEKSEAISVPDLWKYTAPLISPEKRETDVSVAQKDPSIVFHDGLWHVFMTIKLPGRTAMGYCSFAKW